MPANPKYLTISDSQKFAKLSAGLLGGYFIASMFHIVLGIWLFDHKLVAITSVYTLFLLWIILLIVPYLFSNGWKAWLTYIAIIVFLGLLIYLGKY